MSSSASPAPPSMSTGTADLPSFTTRLAKVTLHDRIVGTLVASALGDAVGLYTEFLSSERALKEYPHARFSLTPPTPFARDQHRLKHQLGEWTDDTDHALLLLLGYLHSGVSNPSDLAKRLHIWVSQGLRALDSLPLGLGATTGRIVHDPSFLTDPLAIAHAVWKKGGYEIAPNGSLMRTHPLGLTCLLDTEEGTMDTAARISCVTHVDPRCVVACMIGTALVRGLVHCDVRSEEDVDGVIDRAAERYRDVVRPELEKGVFTADEPGLDLDELRKHTHAETLTQLDLDGRGIGYVYKTLGSGILLLRHAMRRVARSPSPLAAKATLFEPLMTDLIMMGGDADTNACFAGALLGAYVGYAALPAHWRDGLRHGDWLMAKAEALCRRLGVVEGGYEADPETAEDGGRGEVTPAEMERRWMELQARMAAENTAYLEAQAAGIKKPSRFKMW